jgi:hypothetical protein
MYLVLLVHNACGDPVCEGIKAKENEEWDALVAMITAMAHRYGWPDAQEYEEKNPDVWDFVRENGWYIEYDPEGEWFDYWWVLDTDDE